MECQQCGGPVYDNRQQNQTRIAEGRKPMPEFKCKDPGCGWKKWPPKAQGQRPAGAPRSNGVGPKWTWKQLSALYSNSLKLATKHVEATVKNPTAAEVVAAAATIFIAATRDGVRSAEPAPPPPPPPGPEDEPDFSEDDDLPF